MTTDSERTDDNAAPAVAPRGTGSTKALIGMLLAGTIGLVIFLFVHLSRDGGIRPGPTAAHAECTKG
ncbi:MAG TPA: hypothetical protein VFD36_26620, partial [Kofleriaceae bacterium]|nr:hypothetical protein [Kofleriaceae bacterium]